MKKANLLIILLLSVGFCKAQEMPHPSKEEHLKRSQEMLQKELQMNSEQQRKVEQVYKEFLMQAEKLHAENPPPPPPPPDPKLKEAMDKLAQHRDAEMKLILTEEQFKKYLEVEKKMRPPHPGGMPGKEQAL